MENTTTETVSYQELAKRVGDCILNNEIRNCEEFGDNFELFNGKDDYCTKHETEEECQKDSDNCEYGGYEIYQDYIITQGGAEYLQRKTNEIVFYSEKLNMYIWGITHFGTMWSGVFTEIKA